MVTSQINTAKERVWQGLDGAAAGFAIAATVGTSKPLVVITPDQLSLVRLKQELHFFLGPYSEQPQILDFPGWETLPYDHFSPHEEVISQRLLTLYQLAVGKPVIVFIDAPTLMYRLPPQAYIEANSFVLTTGEDLNFELLLIKLENYGYNHVTKVMEHGEFSVKGSIIDIFPMGSKEPYRLDLLDTSIDSIRIFDVDTQRSLRVIDRIKLLPAKEFPFNDEAIDRFSDKWRAYFSGNPLKCPLYKNVKAKKNHPGIEYYLPLFFEKTASFFDYLSPNFTVISVGELEKSMHDFWHEVNLRYEQLRHDQTHPILAPQELFIEPAQIIRLKSSFSQIVILDNQAEAETSPSFELPFFSSNYDHKVAVDKKSASLCFKTKNTQNIFGGNDVKSRILNLHHKFKDNPNLRILFIVASIGRQEILLKKLQEATIPLTTVASWQEFMQSSSRVCVAMAKIKRPMYGIFDNKLEILILTEAQIFGEQFGEQSIETALPKKTEAIVRSLTELQPGDPIVHIDYGIGRYLGLKMLQVNNYESEFLVLEYAEGAKLYVPVASLGLVSRYMGVDAKQIVPHHLGTKQWEKTKIQAEKKIRDTAAELLEIYAKRLKTPGFSFNTPGADYERFAAAFSFVVTPDQQRAIDEIVTDMTSEKIMDRLICGDVGFGKTEVAMRAIFLAVYSGKQVAILVPTTLLAQQHFANFQDRFAPWPVKIALFSRLRETKELKEITADLAQGKIDVVIGTHKLLQKNIHFKNLGLLVIDEEHRFGVRQKEHIKKLAINTSLLALTATPIPRTLNMAFAGIRDFSIISTPPAKRLSIKTFICEYEPYLIKEAILRETLRGGQVYFLHNNIATIEKTARELQRLVPGAHIAIAHGQMRKQQLEQIMRDFYHLHINVLVCTTIIESGIDIPTANTIIINRADNFGLAQLHQLRGRVGRSHHQAYAYLIVPPRSLLSPDAKKRLDAIDTMKDLGTGFALAINDLEIRGAGELLGDKQSGVIEGIGFTLYMEMLEHAVEFLKKDKRLQAHTPPKIKAEVELPIAALIPDKYIHDVNLRLVLYKKIADAKGMSELEALQIEMMDRFGLFPEPVKNLFKLAALKLQAASLGIVKITLGNLNKGLMVFAADYKIDPKIVIQMLQKHTTNYKFIGTHTIEFSYEITTTKIEFLEAFLTDYVTWVGTAYVKQ